MTAATATATSPPARQSRTETFECTACGLEFRKRTKAGLHSRCPKCGSRAVGSTLKSALLAGAASKVKKAETSRQARAEAAKKKRAGEVGASSTALPRDPVGQASAPSPPPRTTTTTTVRTRRPAATSAPAKPGVGSAPPAVTPPAPSSPPPGPVTPRRGILSRILGAPDEGDE